MFFVVQLFVCLELTLLNEMILLYLPHLDLCVQEEEEEVVVWFFFFSFFLFGVAVPHPFQGNRNGSKMAGQLSSLSLRQSHQASIDLSL